MKLNRIKITAGLLVVMGNSTYISDDIKNLVTESSLANTSEASSLLEAGPALSLSTSVSSVRSGETFIVNAFIDTKNYSVSAIEARIQFSSNLSLVSIKNSTFFPKELVGGNISGTSATMILGADPLNPKKGNGQILTLTFKALNPGNSLIEFSPTTKVAAIGVAGNVMSSMGSLGIVINEPTPTTTPTPTVTPPPPNPPTNLRLVKVSSSPKVYYVTQKGYKRWVPTEKVFLSYGNKWSDIVTISESQLSSIPDNDLIWWPSDKKVYKVSGDKKHWIMTEQAFNKNGFRWDLIAPVNKDDLDFYAPGNDIN